MFVRPKAEMLGRAFLTQSSREREARGWAGVTTGPEDRTRYSLGTVRPISDPFLTHSDS